MLSTMLSYKRSLSEDEVIAVEYVPALCGPVSPQKGVMDADRQTSKRYIRPRTRKGFEYCQDVS